jgi:hypothetical protein
MMAKSASEEKICEAWSSPGRGQRSRSHASPVGCVRDPPYDTVHTGSVCENEFPPVARHATRRGVRRKRNERLGSSTQFSSF